MTNAALLINIGEIVSILVFVIAGFGVIVAIKKENSEFRDMVMKLIGDHKAAIHHISNKVVRIETVCESCRISAVEQEQRGMEHRLTAIETHYLNVAENIRDIKDILKKVDDKLGKMNEKVGALKGQIADAQEDLAG